MSPGLIPPKLSRESGRFFLPPNKKLKKRARNPFPNEGPATGFLDNIKSPKREKQVYFPIDGGRSCRKGKCGHGPVEITAENYNRKLFRSHGTIPLLNSQTVIEVIQERAGGVHFILAINDNFNFRTILRRKTLKLGN
jgi:hypothetical protein